MVDSLGYCVELFECVRIMYLILGDLLVGYWCYLISDELKELNDKINY